MDSYTHYALSMYTGKKLLSLVLTVLFLIVMLPFGAVIALSNTSLLATKNKIDEKNYIYDQPPERDNMYSYGYCTYWAAQRRIQIGSPIPGHWGDAISWAARATLDGYLVDHNPSVGAIFQWSQAPGGLGHVGFVESVDINNGDWTISQMNALGWNVVSQKTYKFSEAKNYNFIHDLKPL